MPEPLAFLDGCFLPQSQISLSIHDAGFVMGATVTDLCRTFRHKLYRWPLHLARFGRGCRATHINPSLNEQEITGIAEELVRHNAALVPGQELALVLFATPGPVGYYLGEEGGPGDGAATFGMHTFPLPFSRYRRLIEQGAALRVPKIRQVPAVCVDPHVKMRSRMHWWLADREAQRLEPGAAALLLDTEGNITETAAANVLLVLNGKVVSPPRDRILDGVSLRVVVELCAKLGIPFEERPLALPDLELAEEMLLTSTPYCLAGVSTCNGRPVPWPATIYPHLARAWSAEVGLDIHGQILGRLAGT
jgi:branched-subunit amino acid aminotransferase/4-amino-4-deoxychorismate lyase